MKIPTVQLKVLRAWVGGIWQTVYQATRNSLRRIAGPSPSLGKSYGEPANALAKSLEQQQLQSLWVLSQEMYRIQSGGFGTGCRSAHAKLSGDRNETLKAIAAGYPILKGIESSGDLGQRQDVECSIGQSPRDSSEVITQK